MVFYAAFSSLSVISRRQLTLFMLSWVSPVLGWALKCLAQGHSHEKTQKIQCSSNPGPLAYESNTLPLSHVGPARTDTSRYFYTDAINPPRTPYHTIPIFDDPRRKMAFENIVEKGENAGNQHFLLFQQCFLTYQMRNYHLSNTWFVVCKCFQFGPVGRNFLSFGK